MFAFRHIPYIAERVIIPGEYLLLVNVLNTLLVKSKQAQFV